MVTLLPSYAQILGEEKEINSEHSSQLLLKVTQKSNKRLDERVDASDGRGESSRAVAEKGRPLEWRYMQVWTLMIRRLPLIDYQASLLEEKRCVSLGIEEEPTSDKERGGK